MIAWWPGKIQSGAITNHLSAFWDISPTFRELAGAPKQSDTDGLSLVPTLLGSGQQQKHDYLYWEFFEGGGKRAIRKGPWKLILYQTNNADRPRAELFHLERDLGEKEDLAKKNPKKVEELLLLMNSVRMSSEHPAFKLKFEKG
jgi:arylsulfatase A-like enzyme